MAALPSLVYGRLQSYTHVIMPQQKKSKITILIVLAIFIALAWAIAPLFLPMYRWLEFDWQRESQRSGIDIDELKREYQINVFYNPRGEGDPAPWLIMDMQPEWMDHASPAWERIDEYNLTVRCILISDKTGKPPNTLYIGSFDKDRYFTCKAWRFKPGALGYDDSPRPVVMYKDITWEKLDKGIVRSYSQRKPEDIDYYTDQFDDLWEPPPPGSTGEEATEE